MFQEYGILGSNNEEAPHQPRFVFRIYSHGHALCDSGYSYTASSSSTSNEWLIDSGASYHMAKDQAIFFTMNECNTKQIFVGDDRSLSFVGSGTVPVDNGHFSDVLCVPRISCNLSPFYQITHSSEGKTITFTPHQFLTRDFKYPKHVLATKIVDDITNFCKFNNFGPSPFPSIFVAHSDDLSELWHAQFGELK